MRKLSRTLAKTARDLGIPASCSIELLSPCNLRCEHCYVTHAKGDALSLPVLENLMGQLREAGTFSLVLTGGEIALREDLFDIVAVARRMRFAVNLLSSGTRWSEEDWDRIAELGVSTVQISLYGLQARYHDAVTRIPGSMELTRATIEGLTRRRVDVCVATPIMAANAPGVPEVAEYVEARGLAWTTDPNITLGDRGSHAPKDTLATEEQLASIYNDPRMKHLSDHIGGEVCAAADNTRPCSTGDIMFIDSTGDVFPCLVWPVPAGNVLEEPVIEIFRRSPVFQQARGVTYGVLETCGSCGDRDVCATCPAMNLQDTGALASPSPTACENAAIRATSVRGASAQTVAPTRRRLPIVA